MRARRLPKILRNIVALTLASTGGYACGEGELGSDMESACASETADPLSPTKFTSGAGVDFHSLRFEIVSGTEVSVTDRGHVGEACSGATDRADCERRVNELHVVTPKTCQAGSSTGCFAQYILATRGDQVFALQTTDQIVDFLRPIDTKEEAFFVTTLKGGGVMPSCGRDQSKWKETDDGFELLVYDSDSACMSSDGKVERVVVSVSSDGAVSEVAREFHREVGPCTEGRRPRGLRSNGRARKPRSSLGAYFAKASHLEAASVVAFAQLERELASLGAPTRILRALSKARADEVRHAKVTSKLAKRFGATPAAVRVKKGKDRSALAIAIENAREGCVRETLGAVVALHRAERAADPEVARAMKRIATDELRHARLSWEMMDWLDGRLTARGRTAVRRAFEREITTLAAELADPPADVAEISELAGAPSAATMRALFDRVASDVWRPVLTAA